MKHAAVALFALLLFVVLVAMVAAPDGDNHKHKPARDNTDLANRINHACKPGYIVQDWTVGDEITPGAHGTVKVTCAQTKEPYDLYYVAVAR